MAPTLFMNAEQAAVSPPSARMCRVGCPVNGFSARPIRSIRPELRRLRERMRTPATVITAGWPKPSKASSVGTMPSRTEASRASTATTS